MAVIAAFAEPPSYTTPRQREEAVKTRLAGWIEDLEYGLASGDPGQVLESLSWEEQLDTLRAALGELDSPASRQLLRPAEDESAPPRAPGSPHSGLGPEDDARATLVDLVRDPSGEAAVFAFVSDAQECAAEIAALCPTAKREHVRIVAQEFARLRILEPDHPAITQRPRMLHILQVESHCCPTAIGRAGDAGLFQFIPSTCTWRGAEYDRMRSAQPEDIRYQCRQAWALLGARPGGYWSQWSSDRLWRGPR